MNHEVRVLIDTLNCFTRGGYKYEDEKKLLKLNVQQLRDAEVFLPEDLNAIEERPFQAEPLTSKCVYRTENIDSFVCAEKIMREYPDAKPLVLNLANPVNIGGGVRRGARAQEEDLCRRSSLLINLEGEKARPYYDYNRSFRTNMGTHALIVTDNVEVIKDTHYHYVEDSFIVAVLTCAAPYLGYGKEGMSDAEYEEMLRVRIRGMLRAAAYKGYRHLVLGAFGCGAFVNDARTVAKAFKDVFDTFRFHGLNMDQLFESVDFAVLCRRDTYNYDQFHALFNDE